MLFGERNPEPPGVVPTNFLCGLARAGGIYVLGVGRVREEEAAVVEEAAAGAGW